MVNVVSWDTNQNIMLPEILCSPYKSVIHISIDWWFSNSSIIAYIERGHEYWIHLNIFQFLFFWLEDNNHVGMILKCGNCPLTFFDTIIFVDISYTYVADEILF